jgi:hypothetical protein
MVALKSYSWSWDFIAAAAAAAAAAASSSMKGGKRNSYHDTMSVEVELAE